METLALLAGGFATALQPTNLLFALLGCLLGTLLGLLPGIGPSAGLAILLPITFVLEPIPAIIMLSAIFYGSMYGGTITSVLVNVPGEASSAITCLDGYQMARQGRAGAALAVAAIGSFIGGTIATVGLVLLALPLTTLALRFGPPEFFALMVLGLSLVAGLAGRSLLRGLIAAVIGLLIATVGIDPVMAAPRFTFGRAELLDGIGVIPVLMGLFGVAEILSNAEKQVSQVLGAAVTSLLPAWRDVKRSVLPVLRGTGIGFFLGLIPGVNAVIPTLVSYAVERRVSRTPERFGTGMIEGVAGPETANNAYAQAAMIPLFVLGIPGSATLAILMGAFMMNGLTPGPFLFKDHADFVWAVIASFYVGNVILVMLNLPLIPLWVSILRIPYSILFALILTFAVVGVYSVRNTVFDVGLMLAFGLLGYVFKKLDIPSAPVALTLVLGPLMEQALRQSLEISRGDITILFTRPASAVLLTLAAIMVISVALRSFSSRRRSAVTEAWG